MEYNIKKEKELKLLEKIIFFQKKQKKLFITEEKYNMNLIENKETCSFIYKFIPKLTENLKDF